MKEFTKIDRTTITGTRPSRGSVALGVVRMAMILGLPLLVSCERKVIKEVKFTADDSPVTVRGGSVSLRAATGFNRSTAPPHSQPCTTTNNLNPDKSVITLEGVQATDGSKPPYNLTPSANWSLMLTFRKGSDGSGGDDNSHYLKICSNSGCDGIGALAAGPIYLTTDQDDNTASAWGTQDNIDGSMGVPFHVTYCGTDSKGNKIPAPGESPCNHIYKIVYVTDVTQASPAGTTSTYLCKRGQCDIGIGKPSP